MSVSHVVLSSVVFSIPREVRENLPISCESRIPPARLTAAVALSYGPWPLRFSASSYRLIVDLAFVEKTAPCNSAVLASVGVSAPQHPPVLSTALSASIRGETHADNNSPRNSAALKSSAPRIGAASKIHHRFTPLSGRLPEQGEALRPPSNLSSYYRYKVIIQALGAAR